MTIVRVGERTTELITAPVHEAFAAGQFLELTDAEKLARPSFEPMPAGLHLTLGPRQHGAAITTGITYETLVLDATGAAQPLTASLLTPLGFRAGIRHGAAARARAPHRQAEVSDACATAGRG